MRTKSSRFAALAIVISFGLSGLSTARADGSGGMDSGGGNADPTPLMTADQIRSVLGEAKTTLHFFFKSFEGISEASAKFGELTRTIDAKLFRGAKTIYHALAEARFSPIEKGPCKTLTGADADASALLNAPSICFSLELLSSKLHTGAGEAELLALVAHEVSHLVGTTELEATIVQKWLQTYMTPQSVRGWKRHGQQAAGKVGLAHRMAEIAFGRIQYGTPNSEKQMCVVLDRLKQDIWNVRTLDAESSVDLGLSPFLLYGARDALQVAYDKAWVLADICFFGLEVVADELDKIFGNRDQITMVEFYQARKFPALSQVELSKMLIRRIRSMNSPELAAEVSDIRDLMAKIKTILK